MDQLLQNVINGAAASAVYLLIAVGITFVFGLTRLINFAHGQFLVVAVFVANDLIGWHINFFVAAAAAVATGAVLGYLSERLLFRFTLQNPYNGLIIGLGLLLALQSLAQEIWGGFPIDLPAPVTGGATVGGAFLSWDRVLVLAITAVVVGGFYLLLRSSRIGQQLRATHENATAAAHVGINIGRIVTIAFVLGSALAGLGGAMLGTLQPTSVTDGGNIIIIGFAVAVLGGLGSLSGALKASLLYGFGTTIIAGYLQPDLV
jgi:branched-chain amino acid transport system permease protein